jgi:hypothetical protein
VVRVSIVVREPGKQKPDYSLPFDLPVVPNKGDYISIQRPDKQRPYGEDMIVRRVWWRLDHPETGGFASSGEEKVGRMHEIFVECDPAVGPYSSDQWRDGLSHHRQTGAIEELDLARVSIREDAFQK